MPKTLKLEPHLDSKGLENRYRKARDPVQRSHYRIVRLIGEGETARPVREVTGYSRGRIRQLPRRYDADGPRRHWATTGGIATPAPGNNGRYSTQRSATRARRGAEEASPRWGDAGLREGVGGRVDRGEDRRRGGEQ